MTLLVFCLLTALNVIPSLKACTTGWWVWVETSDIQDAGTNADIKMFFYDSTGNPVSRKFLDRYAPGGFLDNKDKNDFERGNIDKFFVPYIGEKCEWNDPDGMPALITVIHNNEHKDAGWHLKRVVLENSSTGTRWEYPCNAWFDPPTVTDTYRVIVPVKKQTPYGDMPRGGTYWNILHTLANRRRYAPKQEN